AEGELKFVEERGEAGVELFGDLFILGEALQLGARLGQRVLAGGGCGELVAGGGKHGETGGDELDFQKDLLSGLAMFGSRRGVGDLLEELGQFSELGIAECAQV